VFSIIVVKMKLAQFHQRRTLPLMRGKSTELPARAGR
jgi:hypothetical protein